MGPTAADIHGSIVNLRRPSAALEPVVGLLGVSAPLSLFNLEHTHGARAHQGHFLPQVFFNSIAHNLNTHRRGKTLGLLSPTNVRPAAILRRPILRYYHLASKGRRTSGSKMPLVFRRASADDALSPSPSSSNGIVVTDTDMNPIIQMITWLLIALTSLMLCFRFLTKFFLKTNQRFGWEEALIALAFVRLTCASTER